MRTFSKGTEGALTDRLGETDYLGLNECLVIPEVYGGAGNGSPYSILEYESVD